MTEFPELPQSGAPQQPGQFPQSDYVHPSPPLEPPRKKSRGKAIALVTVAALAVAGAGVVVFFNAGRETPMEMAFENCNSSKAFTRVLMDALTEDDPGMKEERTRLEGELQKGPEEDDALAPYFDGVLSLEDEGKTLIISTKGQDDDPLGIGNMAVECVNIDLKTPQRVYKSVQQTRSLDGRQTAEWADYQAQWSYHPNNGLNMIITTE